MPNYDGIYEIEATYDVTISSRAITHKMTFDVKPDDDVSPGINPDAVNLIQNNNDITPMVAAVDDMFEQLWLLMGTGCSQPSFILWKYNPEPSKDRTFICAWDPAATIPVSASASIAAWQGTMTFRSINGGYARIQLMEWAISGSSASTVFPTSGQLLAVKNQILGAGGIVRARDDGKLIASMRVSNGQNEKLARLRFRSS